MSETYFKKFPIIVYNGVACRDITRHVGLSNDTRNKATLFYPYELDAGTRPDVIADAYYDDSYYDWLIFLTNGIVDSYYGWYLSEQDFQNLIRSKYGSLENAQSRIREYRLNANNDDTDISVAFYENDLPIVLRKYFSPNYGYGSRVVSYKKRQASWVCNTNKILKFEISPNSNTPFTNGELVTIKSVDVPVGNAEVITSNSTTVIVKNISGNTSFTNILVGKTSGANATIDVTSVLMDNIPDEEYVFWEPVSYFDWEYEKNESMRHIQLIDANYALETAEQIRLKMKNE